MQQFALDVTGVAGEFSATLTYGDQHVATFDARSLKDAQRRARGEAQSFLDASRPTRVETYTERFSL